MLMIFADDSLLASIDPRLERRNNAPHKGARVIEPTEPWESWAVFAYNSVVHVGPGEYRLYYDCVVRERGSNRQRRAGPGTRVRVPGDLTATGRCLVTQCGPLKPKLGLF